MADDTRSFTKGLNRREFLYAVGLVGGGLALAACQPTTTAGPSVPSGQPARGGPPSGEPIRIGAAVSTTGSNGKVGEYQYRAFLLWEDQVNQRGGLLGRPVKLTILDDQSDPATGARLYEKLITEDKVDLVLGPYASNVTLAVSQVTEKYRYPMIAAGASASEIWQRGFRYIFGIYSVAETYFNGLIELAAKQGYKTVAIIFEDTVFPRATAQGAAEEVKKRGMQVVFMESYPARVSDVSALLSKIKPLNPDVILGGSYLPDSVLITRQAKELDINPKIWGFSVGTATPDYGQNLGRDANYIFGPSMWEPQLKTKDNQAFFEAYMKKWNAEPDYHSATGYAACQVTEEAVKRVGSLDREKLRDMLAQLDMETVLPGKYKVDPNTGVSVGHIAVTIQWQQGQKQIVYPEQYATARPILPDPGWRAR
ncbi:MAG: branched-chain amino acid ABC transporter substrate-binding protein [Dehalococcoidia bacterium]|nr:MAG: branched-chain amino acid ABC transporter substrate-binding protein [Dehalococcoidia bacterium]